MKERAGVLSDGNTSEYDIECKQYENISIIHHSSSLTFTEGGEGGSYAYSKGFSSKDSQANSSISCMKCSISAIATLSSPSVTLPLDTVCDVYAEVEEVEEGKLGREGGKGKEAVGMGGGMAEGCLANFSLMEMP